MLKQVDYDQYAHIYLGKLYNSDGAVFKKFDYNRHVEDLNINRPNGVQYYIGVDYGTSDGTSFQFGVINKGFRGMRVLKEYYHRNGYNKTPGKKVIDDYSKDLLHFIDKCYNMAGSPITVIIDEAASDFYDVVNELAIQYLPHKCVVEKTSKRKWNEIIHRISVTNLMLGSDFIKIDESCEYLIKAIDLAEYDKKGKILDNTTTHFNDALDAFWYIWLHMLDDIRNMILQGVTYKE